VTGPLRVLAAPDKFRGSATAAEVAAAVARATTAFGLECVELPLADGGEGMLESMGGGNRQTVVTGPLGRPIEADWRLDGDTAVIESALACGLELAGGRAGNDPWAATTRGVGELIAAATRAGATDITVGVGGSASTDGGGGAAAALRSAGVELRADRRRVTVCCDVTTPFTDAARIFGPQKGAGGELLQRLGNRLAEQRRALLDSTGFDVDAIAGSGAAGGLAGGLAALGARLVPGFDAIADARGLDGHLARCDLVVTGEGRLDATSMRGKVVGGVIARAAAAGVPVVVVAGVAEADVPVGDDVQVLDLTARFGVERSFGDTSECIRLAVAEVLVAGPAHVVRRGR
jgi:glycerate kinase